MKINGKLENCEWEDALFSGKANLQITFASIEQITIIQYIIKIILAARLLANTPGDKVAAIAGKLADAESLMVLKDLLNTIGSENLATEQTFPKEGSGIDLRCNYLFNNTIAGIEHADVVVLIGTNPRYEAPLINTRLRKSYLHYEQTIASVGPRVDLSYDVEVNR